MISARKQSGLAIITVLLMVALMVTLLGFLLEQQHLLVRRITNQNIVEQGFQYSMGVNEWASRVLFEDQLRDIDFLGEDWAKFGAPPDEEDGEEEFTLDTQRQQEEAKLPKINFGYDGITYKIEDLQARYNLNNLSIEDEENPEALEKQKTILLNLLGILGIGEDLDTRAQLVGALVDWMDQDSNISSNGAESPDYQSGDTPYHAADQRLTSLGELIYVKGFTPDIIEELRPYVVVLPTHHARLNINTASAEVITALADIRAELDTSSVSTFLVPRDEDGFPGFTPAQIQAAETAIIGSVPVPSTFIRNMLQTNSQFFRVTTRIELGGSVFCGYTTMFRQNASEEAGTSANVSTLYSQYNTVCDEIVH